MTRNKTPGTWAGFALGIALILALIELGSILRGDRLVFPPAGEILRALSGLLSRGKTYAQIGTTLLHVIEALALSLAIGTAIGVGEGLAPPLHAVLRPLMILLRSLPMIVLAIVIMVVARYNTVPLIAACLVLIPIISEAAYEGVIRIDPELKDVYRMNSGMNLTMLARVYLGRLVFVLNPVFTAERTAFLTVAVIVICTAVSVGAIAYFNYEAKTGAKKWGLKS